MGKSDSAGTTTGDRLDRKISVGSRLWQRYKILALIGEGGAGQVFRARDEQEEREIALKTLLDLEDVHMARFKQEAEILQTLNHPNIPRIYRCEATKNYAYIAMELVEGISLATLHKDNYPLTLQTVKTVIRQTALALAHAHERGIVHRDVKPANIIVITDSGNDRIKLVDFGIARADYSSKPEGRRISLTGDIFGTPYYMSPEQIEAKAVDQRADIYSLGCVFYELLTGSPPFVGSSPFETAAFHLNENPLRLKEASLGETFPEDLERLVLKMLEKSPADRPQSMKEFVQDLDRLPDLPDLSQRSDPASGLEEGQKVEQEKEQEAAGNAIKATMSAVTEPENDIDLLRLRKPLHPLISASAAVLCLAVIMILLILVISTVMSR